MKDSKIAQSIKARLQNVAQGDNKRYQQLIVRFFHERLLLRLSKSKYRECLVLKGGTLLYAFDEFVPRPTLDIDFMGRQISNDKENLLKVFREIVTTDAPEDGISFILESIKAQDITVEKKYPGVRINISATLGSYIQNLTFDIGFGDVIFPHPIEMDYPTIFDNVEPPNIIAYSLESVVAEKIHTLIDRGRFNSRMKDYYDLYRIFTVHIFDTYLLAEAIKATFENRNAELGAKHDFFNYEFGKDEMMNQQWNAYKRKMKLILPSFEVIHQTIRTFIASIV